MEILAYMLRYRVRMRFDALEPVRRLAVEGRPLITG